MTRVFGLAALCAAALVLAGTSRPAVAFGTIRALGQHAEHHQITTLALACPGAGAQCWGPASLAALSGGWLGGAVGRPDRTLLTFRARAHCDNGDFFPAAGYPRSGDQARVSLETCRAWIQSSLDLAVAEAGPLLDGDGAPRSAQTQLDCGRWFATPSAKCRVIRHFGQALHATQDFYAHTNWTDRSDPARPFSITNPPGLGREDRAPFLDLRGEPAWPAGLISGCFRAAPEWAFCSSRVKHRALNKDNGSGDLTSAGATPRGRTEGNFARAARAATADTADKWRLLQERLIQTYGAARGSLLICLIREDRAETCERDNTGGEAT